MTTTQTHGERVEALSSELKSQFRTLSSRLTNIAEGRKTADQKLEATIDASTGAPSAKELQSLREQRWDILESHRGALENLRDSVVSQITDGAQVLEQIQAILQDRLISEAHDIQANAKLSLESAMMQAKQGPVIASMLAEKARAESRCNSIRQLGNDVETHIVQLAREMKELSKRWRQV